MATSYSVSKTMDKQTVEALEACIEKYERLATADDDVLVYDRQERLTYETCALCTRRRLHR